MKKKIDLYKCDHCGQEFKRDCSKIGGQYSPAGWFFLSQYNRHLEKLLPDAHLCSIDCLTGFIEEYAKSRDGEEREADE